MTCGPGGTGAVVFDLYVPSGVKLGFKDFPGAKIELEDSDDVGGVGIIGEDIGEEKWGVDYGIGYGVIYGGLISGYVGLSRITAKGKMKIIPEHVDVDRKVVLKAMVVVGEGADIAEEFSSGAIDADNTDGASSAYMANTRHRYGGKTDVLSHLKRADTLEDVADDYKMNELNQYSSIATGKIGSQAVYRAPGMALCFPYRFTVISGGRGVGGKKSAHSPKKVIEEVLDNIDDGDDFFFYKKAWLAGAFRVEVG